MKYLTGVPIGRGGMGEVYKAYDPALKRWVALKYLRWDDPAMVERFMREARLQARVHHDLVCKVYEVGTQDGRPFIAMQYVEGKTLDEIASETPLMDKVRLVRDVAEAVHAAHEIGLVHRDLKPQNIMVERQANGGMKPYVMDFGLAREHEAGGLTETGIIVGTPAYMSPEQARGEVSTLDRRTDVYALGAVLYRLVGGRPPFEAGSDIAVALKVAHAEPAPLRSVVPDVPIDLETVVMKCLEKEPERRYASALDLASDLGRFLEGTSVVARPTGLAERVARKIRKNPTTSAALALAALSLLSVAVLLVARPPAQDSKVAAPAPPRETRRSVAVLGLKNLSGRVDSAWLATALTEMLTTELASGGRLRAIPGDTIAGAKINLALGDTDKLGAAALASIRQSLGIDLVVVGSYLDLAQEQRLRLDLRLQDAANGETLVSVAEEGKASGLFDLVSRSGARLREALGMPALSSAESLNARAAIPGNTDALRFYSEGLAHMRKMEHRAACDALLKAVAADPKAPLPHAALSEAWAALGYDHKAEAEAKSAFDLSAGLSREDHLVVEGRYRETAKEWDKAIEVYQTLFAFFPDNLEYGLRLAEAQSRGNHAQQALLSVEALRRLPEPQRDDPRIDFAESLAANYVSDYERRKKASQRAAEKARKQGARLLLARALSTEAGTLNSLGDPSGRPLAEEAQRIYDEAGDRKGVASALLVLGSIAYDGGDPVEAKARYSEALAISREIGDRRQSSAALNNLAFVLQDEGDLAGARRQFDESAAISKELGDISGLATTWNNIANLHWVEGDLIGARRRLEQSIAALEGTGDEVSRGNMRATLATIALMQGDVAGAKARLAEAMREVGSNKLSLAAILDGQAVVALAEDDLAGARSILEKALAMYKTLSGPYNRAVCQIHLAEVSREQGRLAEAEALAQEAAAEFKRQKSMGAEAESLGNRAASLALLKRIDEANETMQRAVSLAEQSREFGSRLAVGLYAAQVEIDERKDARPRLASLLSEAKSHGWVPMELDLRLAQGTDDIRSGRIAEGRARLEALRGNASAKGFRMVARKAQHLLEQRAAVS
jgi:tetratricopeptide (TPR) repeat protein/predicted Ser/Thr protein kinase